jgi:glycine betaine/proline transport system permease protein
MDWVLTNFAAFFDAIGAVILKFLLSIEQFFLWLPWWLLIGVIGLVSWRLMGRWWYGAIMAGMLFFIGVVGLWNLAMMTLALVTGAVILSLLIGLPVGIAMASNDTLEASIKPLLDGMQTMPSFVYLIPALMLFGLGKVPALFATII